MLARLDELEGVLSAEVDHRGELLRLRLVDRQTVARVDEELRELGYGTEEVAHGGVVPSQTRWYASATVRELSREEANVIAVRVISPFVASHGLAAGVAQQLTEAVRGALFACISAHTLGAGTAAGALRAECSRKVEEAVSGLIGPEAARDLGGDISQDLDARSSSGD